MKPHVTTVSLTVELDLEVETAVTPGSHDYWDRGYGQWLPGDPPEVEILRVLVGGVDVGADALSTDDVERVIEAALEQAEADAEGDAADAAEARWESLHDR